jgi:release factor glutamine methyltransferase
VKRELSIQAFLTQHASRFTLFDLQLLLAHVLNRPRTWILAHPEAELNLEQLTAFESALGRLQAGEPLPYILGHWEFYGLDFLVTPDVLIPRPETEHLVETALQSAIRNPQSAILDVATGSGCIAIALAIHLPGAHITATDISSAALTVAQANALRHCISDRIEFVQADLLETFKRSHVHTFDLLTANLPYIPTSTLHGLEVYGKEPTLALDGGPDGLDLIHRLLAAAPGVLAPGGLALLEIEATQGENAQALARQHFPAAQIRVLTDLAGHDRLLVIQT